MKQFVSFKNRFQSIFSMAVFFCAILASFASPGFTQLDAYQDNDFLDLTGDPEDGDPFYEEGGDPFEEGDPDLGPTFLAIPSFVTTESGDPYGLGDPYGGPSRADVQAARRMKKSGASNKEILAAFRSKNVGSSINQKQNQNSPNYNPAAGSSVVNAPRNNSVSRDVASLLIREGKAARQMGMALPNDQILLASFRGCRLMAFNAPSASYDDFPNLASYSARSIRPILEYIKTNAPYSEVSVIATAPAANLVFTYTPGATEPKLFGPLEFTWGQSELNFVHGTTLNIDVTIYNKESTTAIKTRLIVIQDEPRAIVNIWPWKLSKGVPLPIVGEVSSTKPITIEILAPASLSTYTGNLLIAGPLNDAFIALDRMVSKA